MLASSPASSRGFVAALAVGFGMLTVHRGGLFFPDVVRVINGHNAATAARVLEPVVAAWSVSAQARTAQKVTWTRFGCHAVVHARAARRYGALHSGQLSRRCVGGGNNREEAVPCQ